MSRFWSALARELTPYVPGEQPRIADLVKLNTNESPLGPSPRALDAIRAAAADISASTPIRKRRNCAKSSRPITASGRIRSSSATARTRCSRILSRHC